MLTISESAQSKLKELFESQDEQNLRFRVFVQGGGCSGFRYGFTFDDQIIEDQDWLFEAGSVPCVVDQLSASYLSEAVVDYEDSPFNSAFIVKNPQAVSTCGCGESFAV